MLFENGFVCRCALCDGEIFVGDEVVEIDGRTMHSDCACYELIDVLSDAGAEIRVSDGSVFCAYCGERIESGDKMIRMGNGWVDEECARNYDLEDWGDELGFVIHEARLDDDSDFVSEYRRGY